MILARRATWIAILVGAIACTLGDQLHVRGGILHYAHPWLFGQAWWVLPEFVLAVLVAVCACAPIARLVPLPTSDAALMATVLPFGLAYVLSAAIGRHEGLTFLLLAVIAVVMLPRARQIWPRVFALQIVFAVVGSACEALLSGQTHVFHYWTGFAHTVPTWLPLLYATAAPAALTLTRRLTAGE